MVLRVPDEKIDVTPRWVPLWHADRTKDFGARDPILMRKGADRFPMLLDQRMQEPACLCPLSSPPSGHSVTVPS